MESWYFNAHRGTYTTQASVKKTIASVSARFTTWNCGVHWRRGTATHMMPNRRGGYGKTLLLNQFHDILPGSSIARVYNEANQALGSVTAGRADRCAPTPAGPCSAL